MLAKTLASVQQDMNTCRVNFQLDEISKSNTSIQFATTEATVLDVVFQSQGTDPLITTAASLWRNLEATTVGSS